MPRPRPLTNVSSAVPHNSEQLTPRTPRTASGSRTSRLEQGFSKVPLSELEAELDDDVGALQSAPLLASSSTARFSVRHSSGRSPIASAKYGGKKKQILPSAEMLSLAASRLPLAVGIFIGGILLILIVLSFTRPDALHRYIGAKAPTATVSPPWNQPSATALSSSKQVNHEDEGIRLLSYENYTTFPLHPVEYLQECDTLNSGYMSHGDYWDISRMGPMDVHHADDNSVCSSTITYMLGGTVGLTADLALMAQVAALARERNRTFFIDDTYWDRGKWTDHFEDVRARQPGPQPGCKAPPANELVACPRTARHWVIDAWTAKFHLGHGFENHYENAYGHNLNRQKPIFDFARESFTSTIIPNALNMELIKLARDTFSSVLQHEPDLASNRKTLPYVATHIRRGDRKTASTSFPDRKIPLQNYVDAVEATWDRLHHDHMHPFVYLATDSPEAHRAFRESYQGKVFSLFDTEEPRLRALASPREYYKKQFKQLDLTTRTAATRGMIVDLALVGGFWPGDSGISPDAVICGISSNVCRLVPIGLGWRTAFGEVDDMGYLDSQDMRWVDIDQRVQVIPLWEAFELF